ncbi:transcription regulator protein BACH1-like isoform X2 [Electrophorus electricus]|nr:transcription regulator protein BACH1-like isoform X2 [Electrophorus electricus]
MSVDGVRTSVFTFQSAVHSVHVLRSLDQQRQKDIFCDVTVEVESRSFRAHSSVLACCSDYFYTRLLSHTGWNLIITLPDEVTVEGFVPLLQFAYTAKLHFTKENILEIHRCADLLGFHNLEKGCFDFLVPKFFNGSETNQEAKKRNKTSTHSKTCHDLQQAVSPERRPTAEADAGPQARVAAVELRDPAMPGVQSPGERPPSSSDEDLHLDSPLVTFPVPAGQNRAQLCLQNCGPQLLLSSSVASAEICPFLSMPRAGGSEDVHPAGDGCDGDVLQTGETLANGLTVDDGDSPSRTSAGEDLNVAPMVKEQFDQPLRALQTSLCPLSSTEANEVLDSIASVSNLEGTGTEGMPAFPSPEQIFPDPAHSEGCAQRSTVEREVAEHLAKGFWPELSSSLTESLESVDQAAVGNASDFHWLKHLDLGAAPDDCPFLRDLSSNEGHASQTDAESKLESGEGSCVSTINSGENSECDTEGDGVGGTVPECEADLPVPAEQISSMSRRAFLRMLREQRLSPEQLELVQDVRRRSKNRMAAQRCRKRKLDCIYRLEGDIKKLRTHKEKLLHERRQLRRSMEDTRQSLSRLCQSVCTEASAPPEQLRLLPRYLSSDCSAPVILTCVTSSSRDPVLHARPEPCPPDPGGNGAGVTPAGTQNNVTDSHVT